MKKMMFILLAAVILLGSYGLIAVFRATETLPEIHVHIISGIEDYAAIRTLRDPETRSLLEEKIQRKIVLIDHDSTFQNIESFDIDFDDILFVDDPLYLVSLKAKRLLKRLGNSLEMEEKQFGILDGTQYGYVFSDPEYPNRTHPRLIILPEFFEETNIKNVPFTPEGFREILEKLSVTVTIHYSFYTDSKAETRYVNVPLVVYGSPLSEGFSVLQALFDLSPQGGREFFIEDGHVVYDKLSEKGSGYLAYIRDLYQNGYIPADFLSLSEYSLIGMLDNNQHAMFVVTSGAVLDALVRKAESLNIRIAAVDLPVSPLRTEGNVYRRLIGTVGNGMDDVSDAEKFFAELQKLSAEKGPGKAVPAGPAEHYPLFIMPEETEEVLDPVETRFRNINRLYEKYLWDMESLNAPFARMALGDQKTESSEWFYEQWTAGRDDISERITEGGALLDLFDRWYRNDVKDEN